MKKWIWTFGCGTPWAGKYVIVHTDHGDGRERVFEVFGQENCSLNSAAGNQKKLPVIFL